MSRSGCDKPGVGYSCKGFLSPLQLHGLSCAGGRGSSHRTRPAFPLHLCYPLQGAAHIPLPREINSYGFTQRTHSHRQGSWHLTSGFHAPHVPLTASASFCLGYLSLLEFGFLISVPPAEETSTGLLTS